jgi:hypothetical protein
MKFMHKIIEKNKVRNAVRNAELKIRIKNLCAMCTPCKPYKYLLTKGFYNAVRNAGGLKHKNALCHASQTLMDCRIQDFFVIQFIMQNFIMQFFDSALRTWLVSLLSSCIQNFFVMHFHCTTECIMNSAATPHKYWGTRLFRNADFSYIYINIYSVHFENARRFNIFFRRPSKTQTKSTTGE